MCRSRYPHEPCRRFQTRGVRWWPRTWCGSEVDVGVGQQAGALEDPSGLFNSSLEGNTRRAIEFHEGEKIDEKALKALVRAAVTLNESKAER